MPTVSMTDKWLSGIKAQARTVYFDERVRGLALRVSPTGAKTWSFTYRTHGRPTQWIKLGDTDGLGLAEARKLAGSHQPRDRRRGPRPGHRGPGSRYRSP